MILYHINFGYPLLQSGGEIIAKLAGVRPRDEAAKKGLDRHLQIEPPQKDWDNQVFFLDLTSDAEGTTAVGVVNRTLAIGAVIRLNKLELPKLVQWKQMGVGYYALGLEPANCWVDGRAEERRRGTLQIIEPGETREFHLEICVLPSLQATEEFENEVHA
jgi:hypothetical protein